MYSENSSPESELLLPTTPLSCLGDFLLKFSENSSFSVWIKDIQHLKHIMSNAVCRKKWGLEEKGLEGLTTREVLERVNKLSNVETELDRISTNEQTAIQNNAQTTFSQILLTYEGLVSVQQTILIPVFGQHNKVAALVGIAHDLTPHTNLLYLFELYQQFYSIKKSAVLYFTKYFKLDKYFITYLSCGELKLLLAMTQTTKAKIVAQILDISTKTIANYSAALKEKLKANISLELVLYALKSHQQWKPDLAAS